MKTLEQIYQEACGANVAARKAAAQESVATSARYREACKANAKAAKLALAERRRKKDARRAEEAKEASEALQQALEDHARLLGQFYQGKGPKRK